VPGRCLEKLFWPSLVKCPLEGKGGGCRGLATAHAIYALQHLHEVGRLLPALEAETCSDVAALPAQSAALSVGEALTLASKVSIEGHPEAAEAVMPERDLFDERPEALVAVRGRVVSRHLSSGVIFIDCEAMEPEGAMGEDGTPGFLQLCIARRDFPPEELAHHFLLLRAGVSVGDAITVLGYCGRARRTGQLTVFVRQLLRVESKLEMAKSPSADPSAQNAAGDPLLVARDLPGGLLAVHKASGTPTFWPERERRFPRPALPSGVGQPLVKVMEEWASREGSGPLQMLAPLRQDPSGLVLLAPRGSAAAAASKTEEPRRWFLALVAGALPAGEGIGRFGPRLVCSEPLRELSHSAASAQTPAPKPSATEEGEGDKKGGGKGGRLQRRPKLDACTEFETLSTFDDGGGGVALVVAVARPGGVAEQVRRHLSFLGCPVCCDKQFGDFRINRRFGGVFGLKRLFFHCFQLEVPAAWHGGSESLVVQCPLPEDLRQSLQRLLPRAHPDSPLSPHAAEWIGLQRAPPSIADRNSQAY